MTGVLHMLKNRWLVGVAMALAGFAAGLVVDPSQIAHITEQREIDHQYKFINPLLACGDDNFSKLSNSRAQDLESEINTYVAGKKNSRVVSDAAVYFRQLNGGYGIGVNEDAIFTPGSLLKVPLVMSIFRYAENRPGFMDQQGVFEGGKAPAEEHFKAQTIQPGNVYSVADLAEATLRYSDNDAALLLSQLVSKDELDLAYSQLGIKIPVQGEDYSMSIKVYTSFFRILYNATYLDHDVSEKILKLLSETTFNEGIVAGVPKGTQVAHKFGERSYGNSNQVQLHDCGIVYHPKQPYLLCVMLRGQDFSSLASTIADISQIAYKYAE